MATPKSTVGTSCRVLVVLLSGPCNAVGIDVVATIGAFDLVALALRGIGGGDGGEGHGTGK